MNEDTAVYLGDGVYATFDGQHIWLHLASHRHPPVVALEAPVLLNLLAYARRHGLEILNGPA